MVVVQTIKWRALINDMQCTVRHRRPCILTHENCGSGWSQGTKVRRTQRTETYTCQTPTHPHNTHTHTTMQVAIAALARPGWAIGIATVSLLCFNGQGACRWLHAVACSCSGSEDMQRKRARLQRSSSSFPRDAIMWRRTLSQPTHPPTHPHTHRTWGPAAETLRPAAPTARATPPAPPRHQGERCIDACSAAAAAAAAAAAVLVLSGR